MEAAAVYARISPLPEEHYADGELRCSAEIRVYLRCSEPTVPRAVRRRHRSSPPGISPHYVPLRPQEEGTLTGALDLAALAANEGYKDEAVAALRTAFKLAHLVGLFDPQLPVWQPEGHPGYAEVLAERQRRIDQARTEMRAIEAQFPDSVIVKTIRAAGS